MASTISGSTITTANAAVTGVNSSFVKINGKKISETFASNNYISDNFTSNNYVSDQISTRVGIRSTNTYVQSTFSSNNYIQAQGYGTGDVSNNYLQSQLGGATFTGAAGVFSNFSGNAALALRNNFSTSTDYNTGSFTVATTGVTVPSDGYYDCYVNLYMTGSVCKI